ncbi:MAG: DUF2889 domain-containing protein, partial [Hyphomonas sp.]|nr:DUF2889 domain-containing protein [Hyphomonas sp.]
REDGLWDIDATVQDSKFYDYFDLERGKLPAGAFVHNISTRVTIDNEMNVREIAYHMEDIPYSFCHGGGENLPKLVGANLAKGWRHALNENLGRTAGCTHLKEMLFGVATVAFQTLSAWRESRTGAESLSTGDITETPFYMGGCHSMAFDSPVVEKFYPLFYTGKKKQREN